jgi:CheY-like chemotaxis protein
MPLEQKSASALDVRNQLPAEDEVEFSILLIEDDPDFLELLGGHLIHIEGAQISAARDCEEAVAMLIHRPFDLIISDWSLAAQTAPEIFRIVDPMIIASPEKIPVMFMSGSEKIGATQNLHSLKHFEAVSFMLKNLGPLLIRKLAENILTQAKALKDVPPCVYLS